MKKNILLLLIFLCANSIYLKTSAQNTSSIKAFSKLNYYTTEQNCTIICSLPEKTNYKDCKASILNKQNDTLTSGQFKSQTIQLNLPIKTFPLGKTLLFAHTSVDHAPAKVDTIEIVRLKPTGNEVKIDLETGGLMVDGLPFFPFGFYCGPVGNIPDREVVQGFNMIGPYQGNLPDRYPERKAYMDRCAQIGIKVQYGLNSLIGSGHNGAKGLNKSEQEKLEILKKEIIAFKDHPALLSWYINDEPDGQGRPPELLEKVYNLIHELDPYHPVSIVFMMPSKVNAFRNTMDIAMTDPYPIPNSVMGIQDYVQTLNQYFQNKKSIWLVPQAFGGQEMWVREPTPKEIRVMTYLGLINNVKGIQYFIRSTDNLNPQAVSAWSECSNMAVEVQQMASFLLSDEHSDLLQTDTPDVFARYFSYCGEKLIMAVNTSNKPLPFNIFLNNDFQHQTSAEVWFENRNIVINNQMIADIIDAMNTRIYRIKNDVPHQNKELIYEGNLTYNPGFEEITSPGLATGHNLSYSFKEKADPAATVFTDPRQHIEGSFSLRLITPSDSAGKKANLIPIILKSGNTYNLSIWAKSKKTKIPPRFRVAIEAAKQERTFELTPQWKKYSFMFKADTTSTNAIISLDLLDKGTAWFDLLQVTPDPVIKYTINPNRTATVSISTTTENAKLKYEVDNGNKLVQHEYKSPFVIDHPTTICANLYRDNKILAESKAFIPVNMALHKHVVYETPYHVQYQAQMDSSLTNGVMGTTSFKDGNWLGYLDPEVSVKIDMNKISEIHSVTLNLLCDPNSGIFLPKEVQIYVSKDGEHFQLAGKRVNTEASKRGEPYLKSFNIKCGKIKARYIRVIVRTFGEIPEGYLFKGTNSWMFTDEILVL